MLDDQDEGFRGHDSSERWLVSYADFITLLFALFVLLYALSMESSEKVNRAWTAMATGVGARPHRGGERPDFGGSGTHGVDTGNARFRELGQVMRGIQADLSKFPRSGVTLAMDERGLVISLSSAKFFDSGDDTIAAGQLPVLDIVIKAIEKLPNRIEVDGFTDSIPIHNMSFKDNWELSAARASTVLRYLLEHSVLNADHLSIAGYGPYRAVATNDDEDGRARNRRVEIVVWAR